MGTHFLLVSDAAHRLLPTVISRCQRVRFGPLPETVVTQILEARASTEPAAVRTIARLSEGSIGRALSMIQDDVIAIRTELIDALDGSSDQTLAATLDLAEDLARPDRRQGLVQTFHILRSWYRDLLVLKLGRDPEYLLNFDQADRLNTRSQVLGAKTIQARLRRVNEAERAITERMANVRLVLESLFVFLLGFSDRETSA